MSRKLYDKTPRCVVQNKKDTSNGNNNTGQKRNRKRTRQNKSREFTGVYLTLHTLVQQEEI